MRTITKMMQQLPEVWKPKQQQQQEQKPRPSLTLVNDNRPAVLVRQQGSIRLQVAIEASSPRRTPNYISIENATTAGSPSSCTPTKRRKSVLKSGASSSRRRPRTCGGSSSVRFAEKEQVKTVAPVSKLVDNPARLWYQPSDYDGFDEKVWSIVAQLEEGSQRNFCTRGIENFINPEVADDERYAGWDSVMDRQEWQWNEGVSDDEDLAKMYRPTSRVSHRRAARRAAMDAAVVREYYGIQDHDHHRPAGSPPLRRLPKQ